MLYNQRINSILAMVTRKRTVTVAELKERLGVSEVTIRKDLDVLVGEGILMRTHGGAAMAEDYGSLRTVGMRQGTHLDEKLAIAKAARRLVNEGDIVYLDAGTTCLQLARELTDLSLTVVTNSLDVLNALQGVDGIALYCLGGSFRREAQAFIGPQAVESLSQFQIQKCFVGTTGFSSDGVFSTQNLLEAQLKRQVLSASRHRTVLADTSKFGVSAFTIFARPGDVDLVITDSAFAATEALVGCGIEVTRAS